MFARVIVGVDGTQGGRDAIALGAALRADGGELGAGDKVGRLHVGVAGHVTVGVAGHVTATPSRRTSPGSRRPDAGLATAGR